MVLMFLGDMHGEFGSIAKCIKRIEQREFPLPDAAVQVGDFGVYGGVLSTYKKGISRFNIPVYFIHGNHDHDEWDTVEGGKYQGIDNLYYISSGTIIEIAGKKILGIGGAKPVDFSIGYDITDEAIERALQEDKPDIIISHECPKQIGMKGSPVFNNPDLDLYGGDERLTEVWEHHKPELWFYGHYHVWYEAAIENTKFVCLPEAKYGCMLYDTEDGYYSWIGIE
jgi:Icc-related predicted phosphoesterase